jgi:hypothetical protein
LFAPGAVVDMDKAVTLDAGEQVKIVTEAGDAIVLKGPYAGKPSQIPAHSPMRVPYVALIAADTSAAPVGSVPTDPWAVDFGRDASGSACVKEGQYISFHRDDVAGASGFEVRSAGNWKNGGAWKAGEHDVTIGTSYPLRAGGDYTAARDDGVSVSLTVVSDPFASDKMRAAWLNLIGCGAQARIFAARGAAAQ